MRKKYLGAKTVSAFMSATMILSLCPTTAFAVTGSEVAKGGEYSATAHVTNNPDNEEDWTEYDVTVELTVADGVFSDIIVTPGSTYDKDKNQSYFSKAYNKSKGIQTKLIGEAAIEDTIDGWDTVSGATCTSEAVKAAALEAIRGAEVADETASCDTNSLEQAIAAAKEKNQSDYTAESWGRMQTALENAAYALETKESQETVDAATELLNNAIEALEPLTPVEQAVEYVLMNIPYAQFYAADLNNDITVDAFTSATKNKVRTGSLAGGSYHVDASGDEITGVTFPVKVPEGMDLKAYTQITEESSVDVEVTNRGQTTTTTYAGKDALFESATYSYYVLAEAPSYYKEVTVGEDGSLNFGATQGTVTTVEGVSADLMTESSYGDYQLSLSGVDSTVDHDTDQIYGVVISTEEGSDYGLRHLENIWLGTELAWCTGFTDAVHNCQTSSAHYEAMMGQTINKVTYYTSKGIFEFPLEDAIYVPVKFENSVSVEDVAVTSGKTTVTVEGMPEGYDPQYHVDGLKNVTADGNELHFDADRATKGSYTLVISDKNGTYADLTADFTLYTEEMPAVFNEDRENPALIVNEGSTEAELKDFIENISSVDVNGTNYLATGRGAVTIINEDGTINSAAKPFVSEEAIAEQAEGDTTSTFDIVIHAIGYQDLAFQYVKSASEEYKYVYAGLTWAEYWAAENVQAAGDATTSTIQDSHSEYDTGAFDTVSRATTNHGLHRGSYQCSATIYMKDGSVYDVAYYTGTTTAILTNGETLTYEKADIDHYEVTGLKYVPVKVATEDYDDFCSRYTVVENGSTLSGGFSENNLSAYTNLIAEVSANTNGLKTATKNEDGSFSFSAKVIGSDSGIKDATQKTVSDGAIVTVHEADGTYGEFLRVDITGDYGDLGANMQTVTWTYYGDDSTYTTPLATYGTKFAADNWMHKLNGVQLGLTDSLRCTLPDNTDGTGYWSITITALGYADTTYQIQATEDNIVKPSEEKIVTTDLEAAIAAAEALTENDYTSESWNILQSALSTAKTVLETKESQEAVDNAATTLNAAISALQKKASNNQQNNNQNTTGNNNSVTGTSGSTTSTTGNTSAATSGSTNSQTGDYTNIFGWLSVVVLSMGAGVVMILARRRSGWLSKEKNLREISDRNI